MLARTSVKKPYTVVVAILLVIALGAISFVNMTTDLLPSMDLPYIIVYTTYVGGTPETVETDVTRPMEAAFNTLTDVKSVTSTSSENLSLLIMEFEDGADMNTAMIEINSEIEQLRSSWSDSVGTPVIMKLNPDMLPVSVATVSLEGADLLELSDYVTDELVPRYEAVDGVARVTASGVMTQQVDITIEENRIDSLNNAILREVDSELADVELELRDGLSQISSGKQQLASMRSQTLGQIDSALQALDEGSTQLPAAIEELTGQREQLSQAQILAQAQLERTEAAMNLSEEDRARVEEAGAEMADLTSQREEAQRKLDEAIANGEEPDPQLQQELTSIISSMAEEYMLRESLTSYIDNLTVANRDELQKSVNNLKLMIAANEATLTQARADYETALAERDAAQAEVDQLRELLGDAAPTPTPEFTPEPSLSPSIDPSASPSVSPSADMTEAPSASPSASVEVPTDPSASAENTASPSASADPGSGPSATPEEKPTEAVTESPTAGPTEAPTPDNPAETTAEPGDEATPEVAQTPSQAPGGDATPEVSAVASGEPTSEVTEQPTEAPSEESSAAPTPDATADPTEAPTATPTLPPMPEQTQAPEPTQNQPATEATEAAPLHVEFTLDSLFTSASAEEEYTEEELLQLLSEAEARLADAEANVAAQLARCESLRETLNEQQTALERAEEALRLMDEGQQAFPDEIAEAQAQLDECNARIQALLSRAMQLYMQLNSGSEADKLSAQVAMLDTQIAAKQLDEDYQLYLLIHDEEKSPEQLHEEAQQTVDSLAEAMTQLDEMLDKLNQGIIPGGFIDGIDQDTKLEDARSALVSGRAQAISGFDSAQSALNEAEAQLNEAWKEFTENRDEALEEAGIDGIITTTLISQVLGAQNLDMPAGYAGEGDERHLVSVGRKFSSVEELKNTKLFSLGMETVDDVRLFDVADVQITDNSEDLFTYVNGERGLLLSFEKQSTSSTAEVAENITKESEKLMEEEPRLEVTEMMNQGDYINLIVDSVLNNLLSGGALAILILLLFLMDWRPTFIVAISIPASVVVAFVCMYFSHITLNVMSLSGLALGVGMLVDNSIVSIENIYRLRDEEGLPILTASIRGVNQVAGALFSSTLTTICVFLPVVFIEGMARDLFTDMGLTIAFSLLASLAVAMTVVPTASATLFKNRKPRKQRFFSAVQRGYVALLRGALKIKPLVILAAAALLMWCSMQVPKMGISFMPKVNSKQMSAQLSFEDPDILESEREETALNVMHSFMDVDGVDSVSLSTGGSLSLTGSDTGYVYYMLLDQETERKNAAIAADMKEASAPFVDGERKILDIQVSTMDLSAIAGSGITVNISGDDIQTLRDTAVEVAAICETVDGAINIDDGAETAEPKLLVTVDKEKASDNSLTVAQVYQYIAQRLYGAVELTEATLDGREYTLYVSSEEDLKLKPEDIANMEIEVAGTTETKFVRIGDIATISKGESMASINRRAQKRTTSVSFELADGYSANLVSNDLEAKLADYQPPEGVDIAIAGENETVMGYMKDLLTMLAVAILFIFLIMVAQFQSFKSPIIVMFTIPLAFTGGLLALIFTGMDLSIVAMVGFLVLSGVVVNNGIVFIDSVNQMRIAGKTKREALLETGRIRLRPILMTALTTILGMSTMAMARGVGAELMQPMAVVTIGGLSYATLMTLFVVPCLYDMLNGEQMKSREIEMMKEAAGMQREGFDDDGVTPVAASVSAGNAPAAAVTAGANDASEAAVMATTAVGQPAVETVPAAEYMPPEASSRARADGADDTSADDTAPSKPARKATPVRIRRKGEK